MNARDFLRTAFMTKPSGRAVLCIGDEPIGLNLRCLLLQQHGLTVISSGSGYEGIMRLRYEPVDAVILDLDFGGAESALIAGELKREYPGLPVILLATEETARAAIAEVDAVVLRSQESVALLTTLKKLLKAA